MNILVLLVIPVLLVRLVIYPANRKQYQRLNHIALALDLRLGKHHMIRFPAACPSFPSTNLTSTPLHRLALRGLPVVLQSRQRRRAAIQSVRHSVRVPKRVANRREIHAQQPASAFCRGLPRTDVGGSVVATVPRVGNVQRTRRSVIGKHRRHGGRRAGRFHRVEPIKSRVLRV